MRKIIFCRTGYFIPVLMILCISSFGCVHYNEFEDSSYKVLYEKTYNTVPGKSFKLKAYSGDVKITTSDEPEVYIKIFGNERAEKKVKFDFDQSNEGVTVTAKGHNEWSFFNFGRGIKLRFEIKLPRNYDAKVSSSGGDIRLEDLNGKIDLGTSGGDISIVNTNGSTIASTSGGEVSLENSSGNFDLKTSGGDIKSTGFNGDLSAYTSGGGIKLVGSNGKIDASTSGGDVELEYTGQNKGIHLETSGGDINIKLPPDFSANARLSTSGGSIHCDFPGNNVTNISSSKYEADLNKGGNELVAKTSGGDITVSRK
jgi:DUF4097 and DUF4098 domain-containing protein YvlB